MNNRFPSAQAVSSITNLNTRARVDLCDVLRQNLVPNPDTGAEEPADPDDPWPVVDTDVAVRIETMPISARESLQGAAVSSVAVFRARFEPGYDIRNTDRIIGKTPDILGRVFTMRGPDSASNQTAKIMICEERI